MVGNGDQEELDLGVPAGVVAESAGEMRSEGLSWSWEVDVEALLAAVSGPAPWTCGSARASSPASAADPAPGLGSESGDGPVDPHSRAEAVASAADPAEAVASAADPAEAVASAADPAEAAATAALDPADAELAEYLDAVEAGRSQIVPLPIVAGRIAETLPTGPGLAGWLGSGEVGGLEDAALAGMAASYRRLASWAQAGELSVVAELASRSAAANDRVGVDEDGRPVKVPVDACAEVSLALTMSQAAASWWTDLAVTLRWRLAATGAALAAGEIDLARARVIAETTGFLDDDTARLVQDRVLPKAGSQTTAQLRAALRRAVIAADPEGADRRREEAEKRAKVMLYPDAEGTASLGGYSLPGIPATAAMARISALAKALQASGAGGGIDLLRAHVFIGLLLGTLPYIPPADDAPPDQPSPDDGQSDGEPSPDDGQSDGEPSPDDGQSDGESPGGGPLRGGPLRGGPLRGGPLRGGLLRGEPPCGDGPSGSWPSDGNPSGAGRPGGGAARGRAPVGCPGSEDQRGRRRDRDGLPVGQGRSGDRDGLPVGSGEFEDSPPVGVGGQSGGSCDRSRGRDGLGGGRDSPRGADHGYGRLDGDREAGWTDDLGWARPPPGWPPVPAFLQPGPAAMDRLSPAAGAGGLLDLRLGWAALTGESSQPGYLGRLGPITAKQARQLAGLAATDPGTRWLIILTDAGGHAIATTKLARQGAGHRPGLIKQVTVTIGLDCLAGSRPGGLGPGLDRILGAARALAAHVADRAAADAEAGGCAHAEATTSYRPTAWLREFVAARDLTCRFPTCRQPVWRCDLDHTTPFDEGGRTCLCNLGGLCRFHHQVKGQFRWHLDQITPGIFTWTTPTGRRYATGPDSHAA